MTASGVVQVVHVANVDAKEQDQFENVKFVCGSLAIFSLEGYAKKRSALTYGSQEDVVS